MSNAIQGEPWKRQKQLTRAFECYVGAVAEGERLVEPLRRLGPVVDTVRPMTYCELQTMLDGILPPGQRNY